MEMKELKGRSRRLKEEKKFKVKKNSVWEEKKRLRSLRMKSSFKINMFKEKDHKGRRRSMTRKWEEGESRTRKRCKKSMKDVEGAQRKGKELK